MPDPFLDDTNQYEPRPRSRVRYAAAMRRRWRSLPAVRFCSGLSPQARAAARGGVRGLLVSMTAGLLGYAVSGDHSAVSRAAIAVASVLLLVLYLLGGV